MTKYIIIILIVVVVLILAYFIIAKPKADAARKPMIHAGLTAVPADGTLGKLTGAGQSNIQGNQPAPASAVIPMQNAANPLICQNKCWVLHPFNKSKRNACISKCKTN